MSPFLFLFRELLGAVRARSALFFATTWLLLFAFLSIVAAFFLVPPIAPGPAEDAASRPIEEIHVYLSPRLSSATVDQLYLDIRSRADVDRVAFRFSQELDRGDTSGGVFVIGATSPDAAQALARDLRSQSGVTEVIERRAAADPAPPLLTTGARIGLLASLVIAIALCLLFARSGYRELLGSFASEIRLLRLSGISERTIVPLTVGIGLLVGLLAGLFLLVALYVMHYVLLSQPTTPPILEGAANGTRILGVSLINLLLGIVLGGMIGLYGASLLTSRDFRPIR